MDRRERMKARITIRSWEKQFIRDRWGNLTSCNWNGIVKEEIIKLEKSLEVSN
jgi:hypothetical protein